MRTTFLALSASFLACGSNNSTTTDAPKAIDAMVDAMGSGSGSGSGSAFKQIQLPGEANGLYWDDSTQTLYFTVKVTGTGNAFAKWTDAGGIVDVASLDAITGVDPGQIVKLSDGSFVTPQFSTADTNNGLIQVVGSAATLLPEAAGASAPSAGFYRSFGIALGSDGETLYQTSFVKGNGSGYLLQTDIAAGSAVQTVFAETDGTTHFLKLGGLAVEADGSIIVADQANNKFWKVSALGAVTTFIATYTHPDMVLKLPNGDMLDGGGSNMAGRTQAINHIAGSDGTVTPLPAITGLTFEYVAGMAYDMTNHRLFIDDQSGGSGDMLDIIPYMPM